ncbi:hypothetical protein SLA2020_141520 [Shorea laevis]
MEENSPKRKAMETIQDLIEEAKLRTVWWALVIFTVTYFLSHTSKSMWMNLPIAILFVSALRILTNEVEFRWKVQPVHKQSCLPRLEKKQLSVNDSRLSSAPPSQKWKRKIDSPMVEAALNEFIDKILKDFVIDLWYADITPDREAPELIRAVIMDAIGEISGRVKEINLVDLLARDIIDLIGDHLELFRRNQAAIGVDVMETLSSEERDERLKHHLMVSEELHPGLISPESEYKVLQRLIAGVLAIVLRPREAQCPLVRTIAREIVTCLVLQPILNLASPVYINELIELVLLTITKDGGLDWSILGVQSGDSTSSKFSSINHQGTAMTQTKIDGRRETYSDDNIYDEERKQPRPADWARMLEVATQRRTEVLAPENLENMWTKGRNYKKKENKNVKDGVQEPISKGATIKSAVPSGNFGKEVSANRAGVSTGMEEKTVVQLIPQFRLDTRLSNEKEKGSELAQEFNKSCLFVGHHLVNELDNTSEQAAAGHKSRLQRSHSTSALKDELEIKNEFRGDVEGPIISEFYSPDFERHSIEFEGKNASNIVLRSEGQHVPKLRCRVMGAYFEKLGSNSFAVYSIAVTDAENRNWFVKRRYRNFERLHRHLKDIPNYTLQLPPKRIFSSSTEDTFVHQRCIQLDKYLQDLLSIANVAEQHEVWDFLSVSSKNYSFGKSSSVMRTLAVNVDDAVDDIVRQFKGVSDGLMRIVGSPLNEASSSITNKNSSWNSDEKQKSVSGQNNLEITDSTSDNEVIKSSGDSENFEFEKLNLDLKAERIGQSESTSAKFSTTSNHFEDPVEMPPEWTPPNVSVPLLNLVDKVFQLKRRGWLRRQVFWISKQILHLVMDDAIDDFLLRLIYWLRKEESITQGIQWIQDFLWPGGIFFTKVGNTESKVNDYQSSQTGFQMIGQFGDCKISKPVSFEEQLEAARRASYIKKMLFDGAPTALVSLIGNKQYKRCARDIYHFTQSTICMKQLAFAILELLLLSVFPELRDLVRDLHGKSHVKLA